MTIRAFRPIKLSVGTRAGHRYNSADLRRQLDRLTQNFQGLEQHMTTQSPEVLFEALEPTFEKSKTYCPEKTGALVNSGYLEVRQSKKGAQAEIGYARGGSPHYAIYVHEAPVYHAPPTRWKWLQFALQEDEEQIRQRVLSGYSRAAGIRSTLGTSGRAIAHVRGD